MPKVKLVIFDLDNTLVITKPAAKEGYKQAIYYLAKQHGLDKQKDKLYNHWKRLVQNLMGQQKPYLRRFAYSLKVLMDEHKLPETYYQQALNTYEKAMLEHLTSQAGAKELLSTLQTLGIKVAVATSGDRTEAVKKLKATDLFDYINLIVSANETDSMKPDVSYYQVILTQSGVSAKKTLVVGDNQEEDLDPAQKLGCKTFLLSAANPHLMNIKQLIEE